MAMIKVWYPGPSVPESEAQRSQAHLHLGLIVPGWNDAQDDDNTLAAIEAGLVRLDEPRPAQAPTMFAPRTAKAAKNQTEVPSAPSAQQE